MKLSQEIKGFLDSEFNLTVDDLNEMSDDELGEIYNRSADIEVDEAVKAGDGDISTRGRLAGELMDALYNS